MGWIDNLEDIMTHQHSFYYYLFAIVITLFACIFTAVYMEAGEEGVVEFIAKRYFRAEAKAEEKALEKAGEGAAQDFLKGKTKGQSRAQMSTDGLLIKFSQTGSRRILRWTTRSSTRSPRAWAMRRRSSLARWARCSARAGHIEDCVSASLP